jgi:hypothetical protein
MKTDHRLIVISMFILTCFSWPAYAADRVRAGQWVGITETTPRVRTPPDRRPRPNWWAPASSDRLPRSKPSRAARNRRVS